MIAYQGDAFAGSQVQPSVRTVQGELEGAWMQATGRGERFVLAGRTDAGVHAEGQVASVRTQAVDSAQSLHRELVAGLAPDLRVLSMVDAPSGFDARRCAQWRSYRYELGSHRAYADTERMQSAGLALLGEHDFSAFASASELGPRGPVRRLLALQVEPAGAKDVVSVSVVADAFLRQMVRRIVSALVAVGNGIIGSAEITRGLELRDRAILPGPAPASGLTLVQVGYGEYSE